jgi:hypothetical protein
LRKTMVVVAVAFALGGSALSTNAFALASAYGGGHLPNGGAASNSNHVGRSYGGLFHRRGRGYGWGHWGAYYGPMITVP